MNGVIVVPAVATNSSRYGPVSWMCGRTIAEPTWSQLGCARIAAIGYAKNGIVIATKTRVASLYEPRTTSSQTPTAAIGTATYAGTWIRLSAAAMPTNSEMQIPRLAMSSATVENIDQRGP